MKSNSSSSHFPSTSSLGRALWVVPAVFLCLINAALALTFGDFTYVVVGSESNPPITVTITGYPTTATGPVVIPETIDDKPVTVIGASAFYNCVGITSVTVPANVITLGTYSFGECRALTQVSLPAGLVTIGAQAFYRCLVLSNVTIPSSVTTILNGAFYSCSALNSVVIPSGVATISGGAFYSCSGLTSVTLPASLITIGVDAFRYCSGLTSITIPSGVTTISGGAFRFCTSLTTVEIPASVSNLSNLAFAECSLLTSITVNAGNTNFSSVGGLLTNEPETSLITCPGGISGVLTLPSSLTNIGDNALRYCKKLTAVTIPANVTGIGTFAFSECTELTHVVLLGAAPTMGSNAYQLMKSGFTSYFLNSNAATGFTSPQWAGYAAYGIETFTPVFNWLLANGFPGNTDVRSDPNGDGMSLLLAYALNLDPKLNLSGSIPRPVIGASLMTLSFYAGVPGVTYTVEVSDNLSGWTTEGVTLSEPDVNQIRTATAAKTLPNRYMRLAVSH